MKKPSPTKSDPQKNLADRTHSAGAGLKVILGVSGSVAAYRAADLARELARHGIELRVCLTDGAKRFVSPLLFESLTAHPVLESVFDEPVKGRMAHIEWARWADLILIAPATANVLAKTANGLADDMLSAIWLASTGAKMIAPAMNPAMYQSDSNVAAMEILRQRGVWMVEPTEGDVACGEFGQGKLVANDAIVSEVLRWAKNRNRLAGKTVLLTSGPTQEAIDSVRYISNRSSGKMGAALARAAMEMGAKVIAVSGPAQVLPPAHQLIQVESALEMEAESLLHAASADYIVGVAAVADYRLANPIEGKMRRQDEKLALELTPNPDIIAALARAAKPGAKIIGFAAEPTSDLDAAQLKLKRKDLTALAVNDISRQGLGFGSDRNQLTVLFSDGRVVESEVQSKTTLARWLFEQVSES